MDQHDSWATMSAALDFAVSCIDGDPDPCNDRERADGDLYVLRMLAAVTQSATLRLDPDRPSFLRMADAVRYVGAAGPDIDYDVAAVHQNRRYRISGVRGAASYVGIAVYAGAGQAGATAIVDSVDVDELVATDGTFVWEFEHTDAARVIVRQYFHDRSAQSSGSWSITSVEDSSTVPAPIGGPALPGGMEMQYRVANAADSLRWNAQLNRLWTPELREHPNDFVRQTADDIVAAIPNPDVVYATSWWRIAADETLVIEFRPPETTYWGLQLCDRWFQCFPDRRANINNGSALVEQDGTVRILISDGDPGAPNWLDTGGHRVGVMFFRWLHADPESLPVCRVVKRPPVG